MTSAQRISKWQQFEVERKALPYLVCRTEISDRVCIVCEPLNGLKLRVDHPFWKANGVPRHFNCHCDIEQDDTGPEETEQQMNKRKIPPPQPMFNSNPGITGVAFSDKHPYFESIPAEVRKKVFIAAEKLIADVPVFKRYYSDKKSGGYVDVSSNADTSDLAYNKMWAKVMAKQGYDVKIREHSKVDSVKNPELIINGDIGDFKQPKKSTLRSLQSAFESAFEQGAVFPAIVFEGVEFSVTQQLRVIKNALGVNKEGKRFFGTLQHCYLIYSKDRVVMITRKEVEENNFQWVKKLSEVKRK